MALNVKTDAYVYLVIGTTDPEGFVSGWPVIACQSATHADQIANACNRLAMESGKNTTLDGVPIRYFVYDAAVPVISAKNKSVMAEDAQARIVRAIEFDD